MRRMLLAALAATTMIGCTDDEPPTLKAVAYNAGLAVGFVSGANERAPLTTAALAGVDADLICVQEFWTPEHVDALKAATEGNFPHQVYVDPDAGMTTTAACAPADTEELLACAVGAGCDQVCADDLAGCALATCATEFNAVPEECQACIGANIGLELDGIISNCQGESTEYAYGGSFGIGLLSKHPISASDITVFTSHFNRRAVIHAQVDTPAGEVHTYCTHLSAIFADKDGDGEPDIPFPEAEGSWEEEQRAQITEMLALADSQAAGKQVIVFGDLNTGPAGPGYEEEEAANYQLFLDAGFSNPYIATVGHKCSFCTDNPIIAAGGADDEKNGLIDHVLLRDFAGAASGTRVLDGGIEVNVCDETTPSAYSDHYGVSVGIEY